MGTRVPTSSGSGCALAHKPLVWLGYSVGHPWDTAAHPLQLLRRSRTEVRSMNNLPLPNLPTLNLASLYLPDLFPDLWDLSRASGSWLATLGVGLAVGLPMSSAA